VVDKAQRHPDEVIELQRCYEFSGRFTLSKSNEDFLWI